MAVAWRIGERTAQTRSRLDIGVWCRLGSAAKSHQHSEALPVSSQWSCGRSSIAQRGRADRRDPRGMPECGKTLLMSPSPPALAKRAYLRF